MKANGQGATQTLTKTGNSKAPSTVKSLLGMDGYKNRFIEILGEQRAPKFMASVISAVNSNPQLKDCEPNSVIGAAVIAATLDLPVNQNFGFAYILPYNDKKKGKVGQLQLGFKAFVQLAIRTGLYKDMGSEAVYEDELESYNPITGEIKFTDMDTWEQRDNGEDNKIVGYYAYFKLTTGFEKGIFMTVKKLQNHGAKYSKTYNQAWGMWKKDFDSMAKKTVLKQLLTKWGAMDTQVNRAVNLDQGVIDGSKIETDNIESVEIDYVDNTNDVEVIQDVEFESKDK